MTPMPPVYRMDSLRIESRSAPRSHIAPTAIGSAPPPSQKAFATPLSPSSPSSPAARQSPYCSAPPARHAEPAIRITQRLLSPTLRPPRERMNRHQSQRCTRRDPSFSLRRPLNRKHQLDRRLGLKKYPRIQLRHRPHQVHRSHSSRHHQYPSIGLQQPNPADKIKTILLRRSHRTEFVIDQRSIKRQSSTKSCQRLLRVAHQV